MQIPADRLQRDLPDCRCNVIQKELVRRATQREQATIYSSEKLLRNSQRVRSNEWECGDKCPTSGGDAMENAVSELMGRDKEKARPG